MTDAVNTLRNTPNEENILAEFEGNKLAEETTVPEESALTEGKRRLLWLPPELVCMIIFDHIDGSDSFETLLSCSMTSLSWRKALLPYLNHYFVTTYTGGWGPKQSRWPEPFVDLDQRSLLRCVRRLDMILLQHETEFTFGGERDLRYFSALTNLRELWMDNLELSSFMPNIKQCFGHFAPALRSLALYIPKASPWQIMYFVGLFQDLQDLKLLGDIMLTRGYETAANLGLVPLSRPPLNGWLTLRGCGREEIVDDMVTLYGGLRFRCVYLCDVIYTQRVLDECATTLETFRMEPGWRAKSNPPLGWRSYDFTRLKSLRTIKISPLHLTAKPGELFRTLLSNTISPSFELVLIYNRNHFDSYCESSRQPDQFGYCGRYICGSHEEMLDEIIEALGRVDKVVRLVLCAEVPHRDAQERRVQDAEYMTKILKSCMDAPRRKLESTLRRDLIQRRAESLKVSVASAIGPDFEAGPRELRPRLRRWACT